MSRPNISQLAHKCSHLLPVALFACALYLAHKQLRIHDIHDILSSLHGTSWPMLSAALGLTVGNYLVLAGYDWLALRFTGHLQIPLLKMIPAAMLSYAISNNTGNAWAAGGSIRYRLYSKWGVPGWDILLISLFQAITYLLGALSLGLIGSLLLPHYIAHTAHIPPALHWLSLFCITVLSVYWAAVFLWRKPLMIKDFKLHLPTPFMALRQTIVAGVDVLLSALVMWALLYGKVDVDFSAFLMVFVVAQIVGVISQVPGGIGVFESGFLWLMSDIEAHDQHLMLIAALLQYRIIYYFLPLLLAGAGLLGYEVLSRQQKLLEKSLGLSQMLASILPQLYSILLIFAGGLLLVSGSIPASHHMLAWLKDLVPLPVLELSHLSGSLLGLLLLFLARGIFLKIDAAWYGALFSLGFGIIASLLKGFEWREALVLLLIFLLLLPSRSYFQRKSSLLRMSFSKPWLASIAMVLLGTLWLGLFAYREVEYAHELWWQFSYEGNAPRFLRAFLLIVVVIVGYGLLRLLSVAPQQLFVKPTVQELAEAEQLLTQSAYTQGYLALLGDKYLFWNQQHSAYIMFDVTSQFWIAMGDPVGDAAAFESLFWAFQEKADHFGAKPVFYQVSAELLACYLDQGLSLFKLGEEAHIPLQNFNLIGKQHEDLRSARNKFNKLGYQFEILPKAEAANNLQRLRQISDQWLTSKHTREKRFSLGYFDEAYLRRTDIAVVKDPAGQIMAFANLWQGGDHHELSVDLMRYAADSPKAIMDFLFTELLLWGKTENYQWFSLGMAPLAGLERHRLAPLWHKIGVAIFDTCDQFYNFSGLYKYKAKFSPQWQPRYLAAPASLSAPYILMIIARLISGGWHGVFGK